jgi:hypothetical protein
MAHRKSKRTSRILHLKNQNVIGASGVKNFMEPNVGVKQGFPWDDADVTLALEKAPVLKKCLFANP